MKAYEFPVRIMSGGVIRLPADLSEQIPKNRQVRVIVLVSEIEDTNEETEWNRLTTEQFFAGYADKDELYDRI